MSKLLGFLFLLVACNPELASTSTSEPPKLVAERVTATVKREAARLVHLRTEHEAFVTTPEHPFATPEAGWIPAGQLVSGDQVVSARYGAVRVLSVQQEQRAEPQAVFNLTVAPSHTYVVGTDQVLVHNRKCKDPAETEKQIEAAERELGELELNLLLAAAEDRAALEQRATQARSRVAKLRERARNARAYQKRKALKASAPPETLETLEAGIDRTTRALEVLALEIAALQGTSAGSHGRLAEIRRERAQLRRHLYVLRNREQKARGIDRLLPRERLLTEAAADYESKKVAVEVAQSELSALLGEKPRSDAKEGLRAKRRAALEKKLGSLRFEQDVAKEILLGERRIAELVGRSPTTEAEGRQIAAERQALRDKLSRMRNARRSRKGYRKVREDPDVWADRLRYNRQRSRARLRTADYEAEAGRPRDMLEILEEELAAQQQGAGSGILGERTQYLMEHIAIIKALAVLSRERERSQSRLGRARRWLTQLSEAGQDTHAAEQTVAGLVQKRDLDRIRIVQLRLREKLLSRLDGTTGTGARSEIEEARLRELEQELEGELAADGQLGQERLREIQQELGESELIDAEFLESLWRGAEAETGGLPEAMGGEAGDADAVLRQLAGSLGKSPAREASTAVETGLQALQRELREERSAVEAADFALANEHAFWSQTLGRPGSSQHAAGAQRLAELQQQRLQLRIDWRARLRGRLDAAQQELRAIQGIERLRDEAVEAELARKIALLEYEVNHPTF